VTSTESLRRLRFVRLAHSRAEKLGHPIDGHPIDGLAILAEAARIEAASTGIDDDYFAEAMRTLPPTAPLDDVAAFARRLSRYLETGGVNLAPC